MTYKFDDAIALKRVGSRGFTAVSDPLFWNHDSVFGGWLAAVAAAAIEQSEGFRGTIMSLGISIITAIKEGESEIRTTLLSSKSRTDFWRVEIIYNDRIAATADIIARLPKNRASDQDGPNYQAQMPIVKSPGELSPIMPVPPMTPRWVAHYKQFIAKGTPFSKNPRPESIVWIKEGDDRPFDIKSLIAIGDTPMPRTFFAGEKLRMTSTVSLTSYIYASDVELSESSGFLLTQVTSAHVRHGLNDQRVEIWNDKGTLLAVSNQVAVYR